MALGRTPRELLSSVNSADITDMMAFCRLEPFGALADEHRAAQIAATVANVNRDPKTKPEPWVAADFSPVLAAEKDRQEDAELAAMTPAERVAALDAALFRGKL
jgi:hypothetical protein